ncbi:AlwI family type II restriction endonuclease [Porphyromonas asaccharolytica]|uniref:Restriction endonuclease, type II, AlwI n=1 Tax=Porphyromonas asaccharolytica (strain ATCC 25260 / DSM 20707 / BCRC 10618 / CCUG 7834 / JCM 6326 / LMG 13178 / VPI 4198 / B440) TaxID=879243 RepID=F4KJX7_PORAD|nr:AlwI family type II restriction endonuclease [Porphyromonas asaccharolytica]AEE12702.1 Restriction endonuclease, type II, AlwI [Porphyromonas asaccharolytica DSM 20707]EFR34457.1 AlwI restriction endonuclease [Porphyromonas asaccharolytica PR426713P-I]
MNTTKKNRRAPEYKPLLYTTTIRNPERYKDLMHILLRYDDVVLDESSVEAIEKDLFRVGLYRPMRRLDSISDKWKGANKGDVALYALTDEETDFLYKANKQNHKEAGFPAGWLSRFDTQFKLMKVLGLVYYNLGDKIEFSTAGRLLANSVSIEIEAGLITRKMLHPHYERLVFLNAFARHQRGNPFIRELNRNIPLVMLLQVIKLLNADPEYNNTGIGYHELPLVLFWKDDNAEALYQRIKKLRQEWRYTPSSETIKQICTEEILGGFKKFTLRSVVSEYPDDFIRKMRLTGLISLRGAGRFIDINHNEDQTINYILTHYKEWYHPFSDEKKYFEYASTIVPYFDKACTALTIKTDAGKALKRLSSLSEYAPDMVKKELSIIEKGRSSKHPTLRFVPAPARLEFLTALAICQTFEKVAVSPNYPCDDEGLPLSTAGGDKGDIECMEGSRGVLVEVTTAGGRTQTMMECWPVGRHLETFAKESGDFNAEGVFVAPTLYIDTIDQFSWLKERKGLVVRSYKISDFISFLEKSTTLISIS